jgi:hypothetical protein
MSLLLMMILSITTNFKNILNQWKAVSEFNSLAAFELKGGI